MSKGKKIITECIVCGHKQEGWSAIDGKPCEKCGDYVTPIGWAADTKKKGGGAFEGQK